MDRPTTFSRPPSLAPLSERQAEPSSGLRPPSAELPQLLDSVSLPRIERRSAQASLPAPHEPFDLNRLLVRDTPHGTPVLKQALGRSEVQEILAQALFVGERYHPERFEFAPVYSVPNTRSDSFGARVLRDAQDKGYRELPPVDVYSLASLTLSESHLQRSFTQSLCATPKEMFEAIIIALRSLGVDAIGFKLASAQEPRAEWLLFAKLPAVANAA